MSLDKAIEHGKEHRKPYRRAKAVDPYCRNHGGCGFCEGNRLYNSKRKIIYMDDLSKDYENNEELYNLWKEKYRNRGNEVKDKLKEEENE